MHEQPNQSLARVLAPLALLVCAVAFFAILIGSGGDGDEGSPSANTTEKRETSERRGSKRRATRRSTYTVRTGDTLGEIAEKTGIEVEQLVDEQLELALRHSRAALVDLGLLARGGVHHSGGGP